MPITSLRFTDVGPFGDIEFEFDEHVNVFTGPNNSGKTTALIVLGDIFVYYLSFPQKLLRSNSATWEATFRSGGQSRSFQGKLPLSVYDVKDLYDLIGYTSFVPAQRQSTGFSSQGPSAGTPERAEEQTDPELRKRLEFFATDAFLVSDEAVVQKMIDLDYRSYRREQPRIRELIDTVGKISSDITEGFSIQFVGVGEDENGLFPQFRTPHGDVPLNVLSQGTQSIIQWLARLLFGYAEYYDYPSDLREKPGVLIIDEIDAHLHPSWQRRIIPTLIEHFPNLQIFCSTHSPLMLAGLKEGQVQLLKRDEKGQVTVSRNETDIIGWSADEILRNFLYVPSPTDLGTVEHIERLQELRRKETLSDEELAELDQLRHTVNQNLMGGPMSVELDRLSEILKEAKAHADGQDATSTSDEARPARTRRNRSK